MSAGEFVRSRYESATGRIYRCRVQPETIDLTVGAVSNGPPAGARTEATTARASGSRRRFGCTMRAITFIWTGTAPANYTGEILRVPILTEDFFNAIEPDDLGIYLDIAMRVVGKIAEKER